MDREISALRREIFRYVEDNDIYYIADLWDYAEKERADDWFPEFRKKKIYSFFKFYLKERRGAARRAKKIIPAPKNSWHKDMPEEGVK